MQFKCASIGFVAVLAGSARSAAFKGRDNGAADAVVYVQHIPAESISTIYTTSESTVYGCPSNVSSCPVSSSTSFSIVTQVVPATTTICPLTLTSVSTSGTPGTAPVETITSTVPYTVTVSGSQASTTVSSAQSSATSVFSPASLGSSTSPTNAISATGGTSVVTSGKSSVPPDSMATAYTAAPVTGSPISSAVSSTVGPSSYGGISSAPGVASVTKITVTSRLTSTATAFVTLNSTIPTMSMSSTSEGMTGASSTVSAALTSLTEPLGPYSFAPTSSTSSSSVAGAVGATGSGGIVSSATANGTLATQSPSIPPYTGGADFHKAAEMGVASVLAAALGFILL